MQHTQLPSQRSEFSLLENVGNHAQLPPLSMEYTNGNPFSYQNPPTPTTNLYQQVQSYGVDDANQLPAHLKQQYNGINSSGDYSLDRFNRSYDPIMNGRYEDSMNIQQIGPTLSVARQIPATYQLGVQDLQELEQHKNRQQLISTLCTFVTVMESHQTKASFKNDLFSDTIMLLHSSLFQTQQPLMQVVQLQPETVPLSIITKLVDFLRNNIEKIPLSRVSDFFQLSSLSLKCKGAIERKMIFALYQNVLLSLTQNLTGRNLDFFLNVMKVFVQSLQDDIGFTDLGFLMTDKLASFSSTENVKDVLLFPAWQIQAICAFLVMFFPHLSPQLFPIYSKKVLRALSKWDNARTLCLRDKSLTTQSVKNEFQIFSKTTSRMALPTPNVFETNVFSVLEEAKMMQFTHDCIHIYENELRPSVEEQKTKKELVKDISKIISKIFPETLLEPKIFTFGSYASDLSLTGSSDIDICIAFKGFENIHDNNIHSRILEMIRKEMNPKIIPVEYSHLEPQSKSVGRTRFPILTVHDSKRNLDCDLCVANYLGIVNTRMISTYLMVDQTMLKYYNACTDIHIKNRVKMLIYIVKSWAKRRRISSASEGSLASYSYVLMTLHFLQAIEVLPSLQQLAMSETLSTNICVEDISRPHHVQTYDTKYFNNLEKLPFVWKSSDIEKVSKFTVGHLVFMFFEYYANHFNFDDHVISIRRGNGSVLRKNVLRNSQTIISIEDPFEHRDLGCVVSNEMGPLIVSEFKRAFEILSNGGSIQEVLLERVGVRSRNIYDEKKDFSGYEDHLPLELVAKMIQKGELFQGELRVNKKKYREAYVTVVGGPFKKDIFIDELKNRNRAMHGDVVAIRVEEKKSVAGSVMKMMKTQNASHEDREQLDYGTSTNVPSEEKKTYQGIVVAILKKKSPSIFPCILMDNTENKDIRWLIPLDRCYPKLRISVSEFNNKFNSKLFLLEEGIFLVKMTPWNKNIKFPRGTLLGCLGFRKDLWSLKRALLLQFFPNMYDHLFSTKEILAEKETGKEDSNPKDVLNENDQVETKITDDGFNGDTSDNLIQVEDWSQSRRIFTIDPTHAKDLDDAIAIKPIYESNSEITDWNRKPYEKAQQFLITVAIADVSLYVPLNSPMDKKAKSQGTSIYLMNSVEHMLDPYLSQNLCSLHEGVNRYALAVEFIIDRETCEIKKDSVKFNRCIMKSCCRLDYNKTQKMILHYHKNKFKGFVENQMDPIIKFGLETDEVPCVYGNFTLDEIYEDVQIFNELSQKLRRQRAENGNVFLSDMKLNFESDKFGFPVMVSKDEHNESHILIEEMMILANKLVAKALYDYFGESTLLRIHSAPKIDKWSEVVACLAEYIYKWKIENLSNEGEEKRRGEKLIVLSMLEKCLKQNIEGIQENERPITLQQVMNTLIAQTEQHTTLKQVVQYLLLKEMQLAKYATVEDCKNIKPATENDMELQQNPERFQQKYESTWHFALCNEFYTHFTSPIRRYADLIVHRQLIQMMKEKNMLELGQSKEDVLAFRERTFLSSQQISVIAEHLNDQAYKAHYLQREYVKQYLAYYLMPILSTRVVRVEAVILSLGNQSFTLYVPQYGQEIQVNMMKHLCPTPALIQFEERVTENMLPQHARQIVNGNLEEDEETGLMIEKLTLAWSGEHSYHPIESFNFESNYQGEKHKTTKQTTSALISNGSFNKIMELFPLKTVLVDLDVNMEQTPIEIMCYNIWEYGETLVSPKYSKKLIQQHQHNITDWPNQRKKICTMKEGTRTVIHSVNVQLKQMENILVSLQIRKIAGKKHE